MSTTSTTSPQCISFCAMQIHSEESSGDLLPMADSKNGQRNMAHEAVSSFRAAMESAQRHHEKAEWELVSRDLQEAERIISDNPGFPDSAFRQQEVLRELGAVDRRVGRFKDAEEHLLEALEIRDVEDAQRVSVIGELAIVYIHMDQYLKSKERYQEQYQLANQLALEAEAQSCRAIGNLGLANYLLAVQASPVIDKDLLHEAINQVHQRVRSAKALQERAAAETPPNTDLIRRARTWEAIGLDRLTLCYTADGNMQEALRHGEMSHAMSRTSPDPTVRALSRFFYGYALLLNGQREDAIARWSFTAPDDRCTCAIAMCKEPSDERRGYLKILIAEGVPLTPYDEQGYSALDYAVYSQDQQTEDILLEGLSALYTHEQIQQLQRESRLRAHYREIFQQFFRAELNRDYADCILSLRSIYSNLLMAEESKRALFDGFKTVRYTDFVKHQRLPRFDESILQEVSAGDGSNPDDYVVFFSYRWLGRESRPPIDGPDDSNNTQYRRMINAVQALLEKHHRLTPDRINLWLDCACIDQTNQTPGRKERGIAALPLFVAQCNAIISLVDDQYSSRAWCTVEMLIMQTLKTCYSRHECWEHRLSEPQVDRITGQLHRVRDALPYDDDDVSNLLLSDETDRPKIAFLLRQSKLLGRRS